MDTCTCIHPFRVIQCMHILFLFVFSNIFPFTCCFVSVLMIINISCNLSLSFYTNDFCHICLYRNRTWNWIVLLSHYGCPHTHTHALGHRNDMSTKTTGKIALIWRHQIVMYALFIITHLMAIIMWWWGIELLFKSCMHNFAR